jgi:hypothetical protein
MESQDVELRHLFEPISKRRKGFPSETQVTRGVQVVHGSKELESERTRKRG